MKSGEPMPSSIQAGAAQFPVTLWSVVLAAGGPPSPKADQALSTLCQAYWYPLYVFVRRRGFSPHDAEDLTQGFFVHLMQSQRLGQVSPERGKFRSFLLASLQNYLVDQHRMDSAGKRGGGAQVISLDADKAEERYQCEPMDNQDPEKLFERRWALTLLDRVLDRLEQEFAGSGRQKRFEELKPYLLGEPDAAGYAEVARRLGTTEGAVKVAVLRMRGRYRELFAEEIAHTVRSEAEREEETRHVLALLTN